MATLKLTRGSWTVLNDAPLGTPGGFAAVFPGFSANGDPVAIKVFHNLDPAVSSRELKFATERMGKHDPHVIQILDCGIDLNSGRACIVMTRAEYSLAQKLSTDGKLSEAQAVVIAHAVVSGLRSVSSWVHRDLKPGNLLWCHGCWQVADFGVARQADATTAMSTMKMWLKYPQSVNQVFVYGIRGPEFHRVACARTSKFEESIPLFSGPCGDRVRQVFGVSIPPR